MSKTALMFAGQGAQIVGMGRDLAETFPTARRLFERADAILGYGLSEICFTGPQDRLTQTEHAQPGIYLVSWVTFELLKERLPDLRFEAAAGLSLGEFTALAAAGVLTFEDGLKAVRERGRLMQKACEETQGTMAAIVGLDEPTTREVCAETEVELANLNCPDQIVISGESTRIESACDLARAKGARKALPLPVAGAYHSRLMASAQAGLRDVLGNIPINRPSLPVVSNVTAEPHGEPVDIHRRLVEQVTAPVRWEASMRYLLALGFDRFIELGPGKTLNGFMRRIDKSALALNVADVPSLERTLESLRSPKNP